MGKGFRGWKIAGKVFMTGRVSSLGGEGSTSIVYLVMNIIKLFITEQLTMNDIHVYNYNVLLNSCRYM